MGVGDITGEVLYSYLPSACQREPINLATLLFVVIVSTSDWWN